MLAKREAAGDAAGFDRLRAEREVLEIEADRATAATDRARAQAALAGFFAEADGRVAPRRRGAATARAAVPLPLVDALLEQAESARGELLALRQELEAARLRRRGRRPPADSRAGDRRRHQVVQRRRGDVGSVLTVHATIPLFDRAHPERALAAARAAQAEARLKRSGSRCVRQIAALARRGHRTPRRPPTLSRAAPWRAPTRSSASRRSATTRASAASWNCSTRTGSAPSARVRQAALDAAVRQAEIELEFVSGWEIP